MPAEPRLTVAISTLGGRAGRIALPPPDPAVTYLILLQRPGEAPALPPRPDMAVRPLAAVGLSASRNAALTLAETPFLLFGDDDVALDMSGVKRLLARLEAAPELAIVTGRRAGEVPRRAAARARPLRLWNAARTATPEIMVRVAPLRARGIGFDAKFGLGGRYPLGEEYVFLADALRAGLRGRYLPVTVGRHDGPSTGADWRDPALLAARIAVMARVFGRAAPLARLVFALRNGRRLRGAPGGVAGFVLGRCPDPAGGAGQ
ncbi:glycosyltransferase [Pseudoruegeria sp. HB172150]|uniref:glycosyltransferase n=1 Tax=Pseudoruegeria sp. HB172150 TaxID=2721164 RepID=UPI0015564194|nr:glycosyltransferase [Pseudoruegeria sp. HB172150]